MIKESLQNKILFVSHLNEAIQDKFPNVENIAYEVFEYKERGWTDEFAVVYYRGGAIQARNCNMNSNLAIFQEIAKMLDDSELYVADTRRYKEMSHDYNNYNIYGEGSLI